MAKNKFKHLGEAIRFIRLAQDIQQIELAEKAGFSCSYLSLLETGKRNPTWEAVTTICDALDIPLSILALFLERDKPFVNTIAPLAYIELAKLAEKRRNETEEERVEPEFVSQGKEGPKDYIQLSFGRF